MLAEAGLAAVREKSLALTSFAEQVSDALLTPLGVTVALRGDARRDARDRGVGVAARGLIARDADGSPASAL